MTWRRLLVAVALAYALVRQLRVGAQHLPFPLQVVPHNVDLLRHHKKPPLADHYFETRFDDALAEWNLTAPVKVALPPMYNNSTFANAGFLESFVNHGEVLLYNGPYPHPKIAIIEDTNGAVGVTPYDANNRSSNAALFVGMGSYAWPLGFSAWYDMVMTRREIILKTPRLLDADHHAIEPFAARAVHPLNRAILQGEATGIDLRHLSPIVWTFPAEGKLEKPGPGYVVEIIPDGAEVSWMPSLPPPSRNTLGMFLLAPLLSQQAHDPPAWWTLDERFRRNVVDGGPVAERRATFAALAKAFPNHPNLDHYRVLSELGGERFDGVWLDAQRRECDLPTWYLLAWTHLSWRQVEGLPCLRKLDGDSIEEPRAYIAESVVFAFRGEPNNAAVRKLAAKAVTAGYLRGEFRGFNYAPNDFAWLWLSANP